MEQLRRKVTRKGERGPSGPRDVGNCVEGRPLQHPPSECSGGFFLKQTQDWVPVVAPLAVLEVGGEREGQCSLTPASCGIHGIGEIASAMQIDVDGVNSQMLGGKFPK